MKRAATSNPQGNSGPPPRKKQNPPARRKAPKTLPSFPSGQIKSPKGNLDNPQDGSPFSFPTISIKEAQKKEQKRKMNYFAKENINYNPNRNFPQRENYIAILANAGTPESRDESAILANKKPPKRNKTRKKKRDTSFDALKNRPPGMGGRRKTRRKKRRKTKTKKKRRKRKHKTRKRRR